MKYINLSFEFVDYWHAGTGITGGNHLDALVQRDDAGLPMLNGRHIKGLLRQAVRLNEEWGTFSKFNKVTIDRISIDSSNYWEQLIFGAINQDLTSDTTFNGILFVSDAKLSGEESTYIKSENLHPHLYRTLFNTAINESGVAKEKTLRAIEVTVPVKLRCELTIDGSQRDVSEELLASVNEIVRLSLPLIRYAGGHRTRGLGRVHVTMDQSTQEAA